MLVGGTLLLIRFAPPLVLNSAHRAISSGLGSGAKVPDNTLYTFPHIASPEAANGNNWVLGGNQDGLLKAAGTTFIVAAGDTTSAPSGTTVLRAPGKQLLVAGRTFVNNDADLPTALAFARQITVRPYTGP